MSIIGRRGKAVKRNISTVRQRSQITIPKRVVRTFSINTGDVLLWDYIEGKIILSVKEVKEK